MTERRSSPSFASAPLQYFGRKNLLHSEHMPNDGEFVAVWNDNGQAEAFNFSWQNGNLQAWHPVFTWTDLSDLDFILDDNGLPIEFANAIFLTGKKL